MAAGSPVSQRNGRATSARPGTVKRGAAVADSEAADVATIVSDFNDLLASLRAAGVIAS